MLKSNIHRYLINSIKFFLIFCIKGVVARIAFKLEFSELHIFYVQ